MRSASSIWALCAVSLLLLAVVLSGCTTTQDADKRASITAGRTLASRKPLELRGDRPRCSGRPDVGHSRQGRLGNRRGAPQPRGRRSTTCRSRSARGWPARNARPNVPYFQSHAPAIAPGREVTWVYLDQGPDRVEPGLRPGGRAFARNP